LPGLVGLVIPDLVRTADFADRRLRRRLKALDGDPVAVDASAAGDHARSDTRGVGGVLEAISVLPQ